MYAVKLTVRRRPCGHVTPEYYDEEFVLESSQSLQKTVYSEPRMYHDRCAQYELASEAQPLDSYKGEGCGGDPPIYKPIWLHSINKCPGAHNKFPLNSFQSPFQM